MSKINTLEAELVMELFLALVTRYPELKGRSSSVAIISPYKAQVKPPTLKDPIRVIPICPFPRYCFRGTSLLSYLVLSAQWLTKLVVS